ncbi:MAG: hypothetical protein ACKO96_44705, partial [Flammeovirgaceae bacterium]
MTTELVTPYAEWRGWSAATAECWKIKSNCERCSLNRNELWRHKELKVCKEKGLSPCHGANNVKVLLEQHGEPTRKNIRLNNKHKESSP